MRPIPQPNRAGPRAQLLPCSAILVGLVAPLLSVTSSGLAQTKLPAGDRSALTKDLKTQQNQLEKTQSKAESLTKDLDVIRQQRQRLNKQLIDTGALIRKSESQLTTIEARVDELEVQKKLLKGSLEQRHASIAKLLSALQRMGRNPPPVMITERKDALRMVRSAMMIAAVFPEMRGQALQLATRLKELVRVMTDIREEGTRLKAQSDKLNALRVRLSGLLAEKKQTITDRQQELQSVRTAARQISDSVNDLNELIQKLDQTVKQNSSLATYDPESSSAASDAESMSAEEKRIAVLRPSETRPKKPFMVELAPGTGSLISGRSDRIAPVIPFAKAQGKLGLPAHGKRILSYGDKTQYGGRSKGLVLETRPFGQVTSPADGWIVYAGKFRSYGKLLIINAGGGYHILLAGLSRIDVEPGQFVLAAEPVGAMRGAPQRGQGAAQSIAQTNAPVLYVEFRKSGNPVNPDPWWAQSRLKVQG